MPDGPHRRLIPVCLLPAALVVAWLVVDAKGTLPAAFYLAVAYIPIPPITLAVAIGLFAASHRIGQAHLKLAALLIPCVAAPVALLYPWAMATKIPGSVGDLRYFLGWLTRYPNLGPVNVEVLAGIAAMLAAGFLPALGAVLLLARAPQWTVRVTAALALIAYAPVLIRLDMDLAVVALMWVEIHGIQPVPIYGPLMRAAAVLAVLALAFGPAGAALDVNRPPAGSHPGRR